MIDFCQLVVFYWSIGRVDVSGDVLRILQWMELIQRFLLRV